MEVYDPFPVTSFDNYYKSIKVEVLAMEWGLMGEPDACVRYSMKATCSDKSCYPGEVVVGYVDVKRTYVIISITTFNKNYPPITASYIFVWDKDDFIDTVFVFFSCYCIRFRLLKKKSL